MSDIQILLIEDDDMVAALLGRIVQKMGHGFSRASSGEEGLAILTSQPTSLLILDMMLPGMSGNELLTAIRSHQDVKLQTLQVLILSGKADEKYVTDMLAKGANDYLIKPFSPAEVQRRLERLIRKLG